MNTIENLETVVDYLVESDQVPKNAITDFLKCAHDPETALSHFFFLVNKDRRIRQSSILAFVEALPQTEWIFLAHEIMLKYSSRWDPRVIGRLLCRAMAHTTGKTLMIAEICWIQRLSFETRAIASNAPVTIASVIGGNFLYVAGHGYDYNNQNRSAYCWTDTWTHDQNKELWRLVPASTGSSDFYIVNAYAEGYLYASAIHLECDSQGYSMKKFLCNTEMICQDLRKCGVCRECETTSTHFTMRAATRSWLLLRRSLMDFDAKLSQFPSIRSTNRDREWIITSEAHHKWKRV